MSNESAAADRIKKAYCDFLRVKQYNKIKVSDIIKAAGVNRSTFYRHYCDIFSLYTHLCDELINTILTDMPGASPNIDVHSFAKEALQRALSFSDGIVLLAGKNGNRKFLYRLRKVYYDTLKKDAIEKGEWDEDRRHLCCFSADYLTFALNSTLIEEKTSFADFSDIEFTYNYSIDIIDNLSESLRILNGGTRDTQTAFLLSLIRSFSTGDSRERPLTELLDYSGFSRSEFYRFYSHKTDWFKKVEKAVMMMTVKGTEPLLSITDPAEMTVVLDNLDRFIKKIEQNAIINGIRDGYLLDFGQRVISQVYLEYIAELEKRLGREPTEEQRKEAGFFVCAGICSLVYYIVNMDRDEYFRWMKTLFDLKEKMGI